MSKLEVFDPPMCCPTGVCGPAVDPAVAQFAADLRWLASQGVAVERFNLSQQPGAFVENEAVKRALDESGSECLPLILFDGRIVSRGQYPSRAELATFVEIAAEKPVSLYTAAVAELVAIGASVASNCEECFEHHFGEARRLGVSCEDIAKAVATADTVARRPTRAVMELANRYVAYSASAQNASGPQSDPCCSPPTPTLSRSKCC